MRTITNHEFRGWLKLFLALAALSIFFLFLFECSAAEPLVITSIRVVYDQPTNAPVQTVTRSSAMTPMRPPPIPVMVTPIQPKLVAVKPVATNTVKAGPLLSPKDLAAKSGKLMVKPAKIVAVNLYFKDAIGWHDSGAGIGLPSDKWSARQWKIIVKPGSVRMVNIKTKDWVEHNCYAADTYKWKLKAK